MFSVFVAPFVIVMVSPDIPVIYAYVEKTNGFLFLGGLDQMKTAEMLGYVILPIHRQLAAAVIGFYYGGELVK